MEELSKETLNKIEELEKTRRNNFWEIIEKYNNDLQLLATKIIALEKEVEMIKKELKGGE